MPNPAETPTADPEDDPAGVEETSQSDSSRKGRLNRLTE